MDVKRTQQQAATLVACGSACLVAALAMLEREPVLGYLFTAACVGLNVWGAVLFGTVMRHERDRDDRS